MRKNIDPALGAEAGVVGGIPFGILMAMMGMLPMVAKLVGSTSAVVGFLVHMVISAITGAAYAFLFGAQSTTLGRGIGFGVLYGVIWWFLGPLILMPLLLGMGVQLTAAGMMMAMPSLVGHIIFGAVLGGYYGWRIATSR